MADVSRRRFLEGSAGLAAAAGLPFGVQPAEAASGEPSVQTVAAARRPIALVVNGVERRVPVDDWWTLAECLRDHLRLTGTKVGCDRGECGACTVLMNGRPVYACSYLAVWADGSRIETVEGLAQGDRLHPLQEAFIAHDGPQCGFCTPGQLMSAKALLAAKPQPTAADVRAALAGNLCRCSNYNRYVEAVVAAGAASAVSGGAR